MSKTTNPNIPDAINTVITMHEELISITQQVRADESLSHIDILDTEDLNEISVQVNDLITFLTNITEQYNNLKS